MAKASANLFPYVHLVPAAAPGNPAAGAERVYLDSGDGNKLKRKNSSGTVTTIEGGGGSAAFSGAKVKYSADKTGASGWNFLPGWDAEVFDTDNYHDNATNNTRLTVPATGYYMLQAHVDFPSAVTGQIAIGFVLNTDAASSPIVGVRGDAGNSFGVQVAAPALLTAGDYVRVATYISAGTPTLTAADCGASIVRLG